MASRKKTSASRTRNAGAAVSVVGAAGNAGAANPAGAASRVRGRPARNSPDQQARLIDAALACYLRKGIHATSIRDIAVEAGVTPPLVHYYFGGAPELLEKVVAERLMPVFAAVRGALAAADFNDPKALAAAFVDAVLDMVAQHSWWPALWVREVVSEGGALRDLLVRKAPEVARGIATRFEQAQAEGRLNPHLNPRLIVVTMVGLTLFPMAGAPIWRQLLDARDLSLDDVRRQAHAVLAAALEVRS